MDKTDSFISSVIHFYSYSVRVLNKYKSISLRKNKLKSSLINSFIVKFKDENEINYDSSHMSNGNTNKKEVQLLKFVN